VSPATLLTRAGRLLPRALRARAYEVPRQWGYYKLPAVASWLRKQIVLLRHPHATVEFGEGCYLGPGFSLHMPEQGTFIAGRGCEFRGGFRVEIAGDGRVIIGDNCVFTHDMLIQCSRLIQFGDRVMAGQDTVVDGTHRFRDLDVPPMAQGYDFHPVHIGDDAVIHVKCTIIADIGERAVVGANSVVNRPVPPYSVAVGAPARVVDYFGPERRSQADKNPSASS